MSPTTRAGSSPPLFFADPNPFVRLEEKEEEDPTACLENKEEEDPTEPSPPPTRFVNALSSLLSYDPATCGSGCSSVLVRGSFLSSISHLYKPASGEVK